MVRDIEDACYFAREIGVPINGKLTITNEMIAALPPDRRQARWQTAVRRFGKFFTYRNLDTAHAWTRESNPDGGWEHLHVLIHVPPKYVEDFKAFLAGWGDPWDVQFDKASYAIRAYQNGKRGSDIRYITKNSPQAARGDGSRMWKPGGPIMGKRCGTSQNIGGPARSRARLHRPLPREP